MEKIVFSSHSFVDVITNSSSELFICNGNRTLNAFKSIIVQIVHNYNKREIPRYRIKDKDIFTTTFNEPTIITFDFDECRFTPEKLAKFIRLDNRWKYINDQSTEAYEFEQKCNKVYTELLLHTDLYNTNYKLYQKNNTAYHTAYAEIWSGWDQITLCAKAELYKEFLLWNNRPELIPEVDINLSRLTKFSNVGTITKQDLEVKFNQCLYWRFKHRKGDIQIESSSDNSVPYNIIETIESTLNAKIYHLG